MQQEFIARGVLAGIATTGTAALIAAQTVDQSSTTFVLLVIYGTASSIVGLSGLLAILLGNCQHL